MRRKLIYLGLAVLMILPLVYADEGDVSNPGFVNLIRYDPYPARPGEFVELWIKVENTRSTISNARFSMVAEHPFRVDPASAEPNYFPVLYPGEHVLLNYDLFVEQDAVEGSYTDRVFLRQCGDVSCISGPLYPVQVDVRTPLPELEIYDITTTPEKVQPGQEFMVSYYLVNNADSPLRDIDVVFDLSSEDLPISAVRSVSKKRTEVLFPGERIKLDFSAVVDGDADSEIYKVPLAITYYGEGNVQYTKTENLGIAVQGDIELLTTVEEEGAYFTKGSKGVAVLSVANAGVSGIKFLTVELLPSDNYDSISSSEIYVGEVESDDFETIDFTIYISKDADIGEDGNMLVDFRLTYKDPYNNDYEVEQALPLRIYSSRELKKRGLADSSGTANIVFLLAVAILGFVIYKKGYYKSVLKKLGWK